MLLKIPHMMSLPMYNCIYPSKTDNAGLVATAVWSLVQPALFRYMLPLPHRQVLYNTYKNVNLNDLRTKHPSKYKNWFSLDLSFCYMIQFCMDSLTQNWFSSLSWQAFAAKHGCFFWSVWEHVFLAILEFLIFFIIFQNCYNHDILSISVSSASMMMDDLSSIVIFHDVIMF